MNLIHKMIRSERIQSDDPRVYETLDYYEMNLLLSPSGKQSAQNLKSVLISNDRVTASFKEEIRALVDRFSASGIVYVLLVGIPFSEQYHDQPALRLQEDVDFLIAEENMIGAMNILESAGYCKYNENPQRKHVTFTKCGISPDNPLSSGCRLTKIKLYRRITDFQFGELTYSLFDKYVVERGGVRVFNDAMTLFHLIVHAHYYDFHPKILADIYMICKNGQVDWTVLNSLLEAYGYARIGMVVRDLIGKLKLRIDDWESISASSNDIGVLGDLYLSSAFWGDIFISLDKYEMTLLRCFVYNADDYLERFGSFVEQNMCRRVSPMRSPLYVCEQAE